MEERLWVFTRGRIRGWRWLRQLITARFWNGVSIASLADHPVFWAIYCFYMGNTPQSSSHAWIDAWVTRSASHFRPNDGRTLQKNIRNNCIAALFHLMSQSWRAEKI